MNQSGGPSKDCLGQKHLVKCRCVLSQLKDKAIQHQFLVFSEIENGEVKQKFVQCNNCGVIHKVIDVCKSEIMNGKEAMSSIIKVEDIKNSIDQKLAAILERHNCDLPTWEHASYILENKRWGDFVVLTSDAESDLKIVKYVRIINEGIYKIDTHTRQDVINY